jgi:lipopolysaccharide cholinephosphotransferase
MKKKIFFIFVFIFVLLFFIWVHDTDFFCTNEKIQFTKKECNYPHYELSEVELIYHKELLEEFLRFAQEKQLVYFAISGTLIGAIRHGGLMPWDDDIDMGILEDSKGIIESYKSDTFRITPEGFGYKLRSNHHTLSLDIMVFEMKGGMYRIRNDMFPTEAIKLNEIFPLKQVPFSGFEINVPNKSEEYLDRGFPGWKTKVILQCGHANNWYTPWKCTSWKAGKVFPVIDLNCKKNSEKYLCHTKLK